MKTFELIQTGTWWIHDILLSALRCYSRKDIIIWEAAPLIRAADYELKDQFVGQKFFHLPVVWDVGGNEWWTSFRKLLLAATW